MWLELEIEYFSGGKRRKRVIDIRRHVNVERFFDVRRLIHLEQFV